MLRRSCLQLMLGACTLASAGASAAEAGRSGAAPTTVGEALRSDRPDVVMSFVFAHRDAVASASNDQKALLLRQLNAGGCEKVRSRDAYERAAWVVLHGRGTRPEQMHAILWLAEPSKARLAEIAKTIQLAKLRTALSGAAAL
mgnify:CR=1 FL=1